MNKKKKKPLKNDKTRNTNDGLMEALVKAGEKSNQSSGFMGVKFKVLGLETND